MIQTRRWVALAVCAWAGAASCGGERSSAHQPRVHAPAGDEARAPRVGHVDGDRGGPSHDADAPAAVIPERGLVEAEVRVIPLHGPVAHPRAELSGLAWAGDRLILLPQYPDRFESPHDGKLFAIPRDSLVAHIAASEAGASGPGSGPGIEPEPIDLIAPGLERAIPGFQGFESIAFLDDQVFATVEADDGEHMAAYLVRGHLSADGYALTLDTRTDALAKIPAASDIPNASDETLLVVGDRVATLYEANGKNINPAPRAHVFDTALRPLGTIPAPTLEYRVTDATALDEGGRFWVMHYMYPNDVDVYRPAEDLLAARYGRGPSHADSPIVERLVELHYTRQGIELVDHAPVALRLGPVGRNWEGVARMGRDGFLLVTDRYPETVFGYVRLPRIDN